jgi:hypothetical protein
MSGDAANRINTIAYAVNYHLNVGDSVVSGRLSDSYPRLSPLPDPPYNENVSFHSYDKSVGLYHNLSIDGNIDRARMHSMFKSVKDRFHADDGKEQSQRGAPGQYNVVRGDISAISGNTRSRDTYFTHKSVFKSKIPRVQQPNTDDDRDSNWNLDKDKKTFWAPKDYTKFAHDARLSHINHKSACKTEYYELEKRCTLVPKYMPTAVLAGQRHSNLSGSGSGSSNSSSTGESRLFSKNGNGAMKAECLDLSGCELEVCSEMAEVTQLCFDAARKAKETGSQAEKMTYALQQFASSSASGVGSGAACSDKTPDGARRVISQHSGGGDATFRKKPSGHGIDSKKAKKVKVPMAVRAIRMANNKLSSLDGLDEAVETLGLACTDICWLDTSFNQLVDLSNAITKFSALQSLTLTNNRITKVATLNQLVKLKNLTALHLVGNPVTDVKNYRCKIIGLLPQLIKLDSIIITKKERDLGKYLVPKKKPRKRNTEGG